MINFDSKDELFSDAVITANVLALNGITLISVTLGTLRSVQDWQLEKHMPMFEADMTAAQKTKAAAIIAKFKK